MKKTFLGILAFLAALSVIAVLLIYSEANTRHYTAHMEADIASETLLAKVLYENGHVQPDSWFMSTAQRIIAPPMLASFIYPRFGFDLNLSLGLACSFLIVILIASMLFFNREVGFGVLESLVAILLTMVLSSPANEPQRMLFLYASYYVGHFICMFLLLGFYARMLKAGKLSIVALIVTIPMAVVNGMQGMHANMFFYTPLLGTEVLRRIILFLKKKRADSNAVSVWAFLVTLISLVCTKIFGAHMSSETSRNIRHAPEKFVEIVWPLFKEVLGYGRLPYLVFLFVILAFAGYLLVFKSLNDKPELWSTLPIVFGVIVTVISMTFTTIEVAPRYFLMQIFVVGVGTALLMRLFKPEISYWLAVLVIVYGVHSAFAFYGGLIKDDDSANSEYVRIAEWMESNGYDYGYSTFDHANTLTVMCNDAVQVRPVTNMDELEGLKWLSDATWYPPIKDSSKAVCYVVSVARLEDFQSFIDRENPKILDTVEFDNFVVYVTDHDYTKLVK